MTQSAQPVINQPFLYSNGFKLSVASNTTLTCTAGQCRDSTNTYDINLGNYLGANPNLDSDTSVTLTATVNGVNGLDTGDFDASKTYAVFAISDPITGNATALLMSLSATTPLMPFGYSAFRRIGWAFSDSSTHFIAFDQTGNRNEKFYQWATPISVLTAGTANSNFAAVSLAAGAPDQATPVYLYATLTPNAASDTLDIRPTGSSSAAGSCPIRMVGQVASVVVAGNMIKLLPLLSGGHASLDYKLNTGSAAATIKVAAFEDTI